MNCVYYYKDKLIGDIIKLDDFLISQHKYYSKFGDKVFLINPKIHDILKTAEKENKKVAEQWNKTKKSYVGETELIKLKRPFVGVTEFLSGQRNENGDLYFPEFIEDNYWSERFRAWTHAQKATLPNNSDGFTLDEIDVFFGGGEIKKIWESAELQRLRALMTDKWEHQAKYGTEIHNVLEAYFKAPDNIKDFYDLAADGNNNMYFGKLVSELRRSYLAEILNSEGKLETKTLSKITDITTDAKIKQILLYAKQLRKELKTKYGDNLTFYPEFSLSAKLNKTYEDRNDLSIAGRVDLLIVDEKGYPHILDYKTSPKFYEDYATAKKRGFTYLLATYERMLRRLGLNTSKTDLIVAPLLMKNFKRVGDSWNYDEVVLGTTRTRLIHTLEDEVNQGALNSNLDEFIEAPNIPQGSAIGVIEKVTKAFNAWFPKNGNSLQKTDEEIKKLIDDQGGFKFNATKNVYEFSPKGYSHVITVTKELGEAALFKKVKQLYNGDKELVTKKTLDIIKAIEDAKKHNSDQIKLSRKNDDWVRNTLSKYCSKDWIILDDDAGQAALEFGMILFYNENLGVLEVVKVTSKFPKASVDFGPNRTNLTGAHEIDLTEDSKSNSLMLKAINGNIDLMEAMLVLNNLQFDKDILIGKMQVINPNMVTGVSANNSELLYSFNKLLQLKPFEEDNNFKNGNLKFLTNSEQLWLEYNDIMNRLSTTNTWQKSQFEEIRPLINAFHDFLPTNIETAYQKLLEISKILENELGMRRTRDGDRNVHSGVRQYNTDYTRILYQKVLQSILELRNFNIRLAIEDHSMYLDNINIVTKGISGNMLDNANNFANKVLNLVTSTALEGYLNARDQASVKLTEARLKTEELKKALGYSGIIEHTVGNQASLYDGMIEHTADGDIRFVNPWKSNTLHPAKAEYLKWAILELNKNKNPYYSLQLIEQLILEDDVTFFLVPLMKASFASKVNNEGWLGWLKNKLKRFTSWKKIKETFADAASEFLDDSSEKQASIDLEIFLVTNLMSLGDGPDRKQKIHDNLEKYGKGVFELDVEKILATLTWAYATQQALEDRMILLKAAYISLNVMGNELNYSFNNDEKFLRDFTENRINHKSIDAPNLRPYKGMVGVLQKAVSFMALAFSPVLFTGLNLEGIWKACKLIITKPDGTETFTSQNMVKSAKTVYKELFHFSDIPSTCSAINSLYGINDMDNVSFAQNNTSDRHGMFNFFGRFAYLFSSRPDFYNRMTIFVALMMLDGCWEAHSVDLKTGQLKYDYKKDKRFAAYANDPEGKNVTNLEEYNKAKALYYTVARQMVNEGVRNKDGSLFTIGQPLPKAYSNKESEAKKAVGDSMYGYYDSTKKSLVNSIFLGGLLMLMRTYWSAKKNLYFAPGGIKAQGKWVQAELDKIDPNTGNVMVDLNTGKPIKEKVYYAKTKDGEVDTNTCTVESDPNRSDVPFMQWKGKFEEGVILTLAKYARELKNTKSLKQAWENLMNQDPELAKVYKSNIKLFASDLLMWALIGLAMTGFAKGIADDDDDEFKKSGHMSDAARATFSNLVYRTLKYSSNDFMWANAIFDISMDWNPMALSYLGNELNTLGNFITGDEEFSDVMVKSFTAARLVRPIFECIKDDQN